MKTKRQSLPASLRKDDSENAYQEAKQKGQSRPLIQEKRFKEWKHWALIDNRFPYDMAFSTHHMLIPLREVPGEELNNQERQELEEILDELSEHYDSFQINFKSKQSILNHFHIHLLIFKDNREEMAY